MIWPLLAYGLPVFALLALFVWSLWHARRHPRLPPDIPSLANLTLRHVAYFPQVRQALSVADFDFLAARGSARLARHVRGERRRIARVYLDALHEDFRGLLQMARVLAALSSDVRARQEGDRLRLAVRLECRFALLRLLLVFGTSPLSQMDRVTQIVGVYSARLEAAMASLGERAMLAGQIASVSDRGGVGLT